MSAVPASRGLPALCSICTRGISLRGAKNRRNNKDKKMKISSICIANIPLVAKSGELLCTANKKTIDATLRIVNKTIKC